MHRFKIHRFKVSRFKVSRFKVSRFKVSCFKVNCFKIAAQNGREKALGNFNITVSSVNFKSSGFKKPTPRECERSRFFNKQEF